MKKSTPVLFVKALRPNGEVAAEVKKNILV
jgi:hypothetical protein